MNEHLQSACIANLTWPQIKAAQQACPLLVLPLGATEQHGPALPINTDSVIAEALCKEACSQAHVSMAPTMPYTASGAHTTKWPGTFAVNSLTFIETIVQWARWAEATGWTKLLLLNAHAGNDAPLRVAVDQIRCELMGTLQVGYLNTFFLNAEIEAHFVQDAADLHANKGECDLMLFLAPESVDHSALSSSDDPDRTEDLVFSYPVSQTSLNGTTGSPSLGNADDGKRLFEMMTQVLVEKLTTAKLESAPLPKEAWATTPKDFY